MSDGQDALRVLGISGSLRKGSFNTMALRVAQGLVPAGMTIETAEIGNLPLYNDDVRAAGYPPVVQAFRDKIAAADALLFVTPEYNYSVSGVLKNAIDWGSRPPSQPFDGKPVAVMGASGGVLGTARAQYHLRQMCVFLNMYPLNKPEVMIAQAQTRFDAAGNLTDETTRGFIRKMLEKLVAWTRELQELAAKRAMRAGG